MKCYFFDLTHYSVLRIGIGDRGLCQDIAQQRLAYVRYQYQPYVLGIDYK